MRSFRTIAAAIAIAMSGCATVERLGRPPSPDEVARVNEAAHHGSLSVSYAPYVPPEEPDQPRAAEPDCAGGRCGLDPLMRDGAVPVAIAAADARTLTFALANGERATLPLERVRAVDVAGVDRGRVALIGAALGGSATFAFLGLGALVGRMEPGSRCDATCARTFVVGTLGGAAVGALIGAVVGTTRRFEF